MTDATPSPALPPTTEEAPYVPISWMAVSAATVACLFVAVMLFAGYSAIISQKPLIVSELLVLPVLTGVLCFAARRLVQNSEGTRTSVGKYGIDLINSAWWVALIGGLSYAAYLFGIEYSVRRDAEGEVQKWVGFVVKGDLNRAFIRTQDPGRRAKLNPDDTQDIVNQFRSEYQAFGQSDVVRLAKRNPGACEFIPIGLKDWSYKPGTMECVFAGVIKCPEGKFPIDVPVRGFEAVAGSESVGRQWNIGVTPTGWIGRDITRTPYGWRISDLEQSANDRGKTFVNEAGLGPFERAMIYQSGIREDANPQFWKGVELFSCVGSFPLWRGPLPILVMPFVDYGENVKAKFFKLPGGGEPTSEQKAKFLIAWHGGGLKKPGTVLQGNDKIDVNDVMTITDTAVEVRVPCEIPLPPVGGVQLAARARVVLVCTDSEILADLKRLRAEANPDQGTLVPSADFLRSKPNWRIARIETDLHEVRNAPPQGGPGGPGGGMGGPH